MVSPSEGRYNLRCSASQNTPPKWRDDVARLGSPVASTASPSHGNVSVERGVSPGMDSRGSTSSTSSLPDFTDPDTFSETLSMAHGCTLLGTAVAGPSAQQDVVGNDIGSFDLVPPKSAAEKREWPDIDRSLPRARGVAVVHLGPLGMGNDTPLGALPKIPPVGNVQVPHAGQSQCPSASGSDMDRKRRLIPLKGSEWFVPCILPSDPDQVPDVLPSPTETRSPCKYGTHERTITRAHVVRLSKRCWGRKRVISPDRCRRPQIHVQSGEGARGLWASNMCHLLRRDLESTLVRGHKGLGRRPLKLGTDCAGAEAPVFAMRELERALADLGVQLRTDHLFSCDIGTASREFIKRNCQPRALFPDLLARSTVSHCILAGRPRLVPELDIYVAGFPCKDFSTLNRFRPALLGPHACIFRGVVGYIERFRPRAYVLENVDGLTKTLRGASAPIFEVMRTLRAIRGYEVRGWKVNTLDFYLPQNRKRVYIVGVNKDKVHLRKPLKDWGKVLKKLESRASVGVQRFLLDDDHPQVKGQRERLASGLGRSTASRTCKWIEKHRILRAKLGLSEDSVHPYLSADRGWMSLLPPRTLETLALTSVKVQQISGGHSPETTHYVGEISQGFDYVSILDDISPCVAPLSRLWIFNRYRWAVGLEKFALQGFPCDELDVTGLSESEINALAGNSMSLPVVGAFLALLLAFVDFGT